MSKLKASEEFVVGKHKIGWVDSDFKTRFGKDEFDAVSIPPTFQKLGRNMADAEIESELKPGFCTLGDVLAFLDNAPEECKDGWSNLFYTPSFVVRVHWLSFGGGWFVRAWVRDGRQWLAEGRVFSPATIISEPKISSDSQTLESLDPLVRIAVALERIADVMEYPQIEISGSPIASMIPKNSAKNKKKK